MKKISVIVPIFNAEKFLQRCVNSIINQTYKNLEIILVDDGSTDNSRKICNKYKMQDERIKVIYKENGGQSSARNVGLEVMTGDYVAFVDSDDWIVEDIYEYSINLAETMKCDVVDFKILFTNLELTKFNSNTRYSTEIIQEKEILRDYLLRGQTEKAPFSPCRKLYKRNVFEDIRFPEGKINEDIVTNYKVLIKSNRLVHTDKIGYFYFQNNNSTTRGGLKKRDFDLLDACKELQKLTQDENYPDVKYLAEIKLARSYFSLLAKIAFYGIDDKSLDKSFIIKELTRKLRQNYFLLISSPMPLNRKIMITALSINMKCLSIPLYIYKLINKEVNI